MVISPPAGAPMLVSPLRLAAPHPRKLSRAAWFAVAGSVALHLAGAVWIYNQDFRNPPDVISDPGPPPLRVQTVTLKPKPPESSPAPKQPRAVTPHTTVRAPDVTPAPFPPVPPRPGDETTSPPIIVAEPPQVAPVGEKPSVAGPVSPPGPKIIRDPMWLSRPTPEEMGRFYPQAATDADMGGAATLRCQVLVTGAVANCSVVQEQPKGYGFGAAAVKLSRFFRMSPRTVDGQPVDGASVVFALQFKLAD